MSWSNYNSHHHPSHVLTLDMMLKNDQQLRWESKKDFYQNHYLRFDFDQQLYITAVMPLFQNDYNDGDNWSLRTCNGCPSSETMTANLVYA